MKETITVQFDGGSRGNPGPAGVGIVLRAEDQTPLVTLGRFIGRATNNVAEYRALILGLEQALKLGARRITVKGDSELIVKQMRGEYRVKNPDLRELYEQAQSLIEQFDHATIDHNYRSKNALADKLANLAMDRRTEVKDADDSDVSDSRGALNGGAARPAAAVPRSTQPAHGPSPVESAARVEDTFGCPRCGCVVRVTAPSTRPPEGQGPFQCVCGVRMRRLEG